MDSSLAAAIITSVTTAASTAGVAITALVLNNKRFDGIDKRFERIEARLDKIEASIEILIGALHELDKRVSIIEDRIFNREGGR